MKRLPSEDDDTFIGRLSLARKRGGEKGSELFHALNLECSEEQAAKYVIPSADDLATGIMLRRANTGSTHGRRGAGKLNEFGEVPGFCRITNTSKRLKKQEMKQNVDDALSSLRRRKTENKIAKRKKAEEIKAAKDARAAIRNEKAAESRAREAALKRLLGVCPANKKT